MKIIVNGEPRDVADRITAADLVRDLELEGQRIAMEINGEIQPRSGYAERLLESGDRIEIVRAIGGG